VKLVDFNSIAISDNKGIKSYKNNGIKIIREIKRLGVKYIHWNYLN
jgi:hypothetical protein